jgi:hypothetical protein
MECDYSRPENFGPTQTEGYWSVIREAKIGRSDADLERNSSTGEIDSIKTRNAAILVRSPSRNQQTHLRAGPTIPRRLRP